MKNRFISVSFFILVLILVAFDVCSAGKYAAEFLQNGIGARALAMGGSAVSNPIDGSAPYWNPAGIGTRNRPTITAMHAFLFDNLANYDYISAMIPVKADVAVAISWVRLAIDRIPQYPTLEATLDQRITDPSLRPSGVPLAFFSDSENAYIFTFARHSKFNAKISGLDFGLPVEIGYGVNLKYINHKLYEYVATGTGIDVGFLLGMDMSELLEYKPLGWIYLGANLQDITETKIIWSTPSAREDIIPKNYKTGISYRHIITQINSDITISADADTRYGYTRHYGIELTYNSMDAVKKSIDEYRYKLDESYEKYNYDDYRLPTKEFSVRTGLDNNHLTAGAGIKYRAVILDYAFVKYDLGNTHRISLQFDF